MKSSRDISKELLAGISAIKKGKGKKYQIEEPEDIIKIREDLNLSQSDFSSLLRVSIRTLQDWEQGRRFPRGPALSLLLIAKKHPEVFISK